MKNHEAREIYQEMMSESDIRRELDSLRPNQHPALKIIAALVAMAIFVLIPIIFPDAVSVENIYFMIFFAIISGQGMSLHESKNIYRRIDLLQKLNESRLAT